MTVLLCADHGTPDLEDAVSVAGLCRDVTRAVEAAEEAVLAEVNVLGLHPGEFTLSAVQAELRKRGRDPLGVVILDLMPDQDDEARLAARVAAAQARAAAYPGATPEQMKLVMPKAVSRRALLTMRAPSYIGAPAIDPDVCAAGIGCQACVPACPADALSWSAGTIAYDKDACVACGICVTTCTTGAVVNPSVTPAQIQAEIMTLVDRAADPAVGIAYVCRDGDIPALPEGWYPVRVACSGMVTAGWALAPLALGAGGVALLPCGDTGCRIGNDPRTESSVRAAATILAELGGGAGRVVASPVAPPQEPLLPGIETLRDPFGPVGEAEVVAALAAALQVERVEAEVPGARLGIVSIDPEPCTACTQCAQICPTGALTHISGDGRVEISFDARKCVACAQCLGVCPEAGAISVWNGLRWPELVEGPHVIREESTAACEVCGQPIAPTAMLERISSILGDEHAATLDLIGRRCLNCR